jgi:hypothetical protein
MILSPQISSRDNYWLQSFNHTTHTGLGLCWTSTFWWVKWGGEERKQFSTVFTNKSTLKYIWEIKYK